MTTRFQDHLIQRAVVMTRSDIALLYNLSEDTIERLEWMALQTFDVLGFRGISLCQLISVVTICCKDSDEDILSPRRNKLFCSLF